MQFMKTEIPEGYKITPLGIIPEEWEVKQLEDIADITSGGTPSRKIADNWNGNIPWVTTSLLNKSKIQSTEEHITQNGLNNSATKILPTNTVLMAMYGQGQTRGKVSILRIEAATNQACAAIVVNKSARYDYIFYQLSNMYDIIRNLSNDGSQKNLNLQLIKNIQVTLPPLPEQQKIAEILSVWDVAIEKQTLLIEKLEHRKRALMQQLLTGKKRLKGFEGEWKKYKLKNIGKTYNGLAGKSKDDFGSGKPYISYVNIFNNTVIDISVFEYVKVGEDECQNRVQFGDIFFTVSSETQHEVGMSSVLLDNVEDTYLNSFCFGFRLYDFDYVSPYFISYYLRGSAFRKKILKLSQGATRYNLSKEGVLKLQVKLPSLLEQTAIAEILSTADQEIHIAKEKLEQLKKQKKGLMQVLLTGKKRVITTTNTQTNENIRNQKSIRAV